MPLIRWLIERKNDIALMCLMVLFFLVLMYS